jgi:glycosyltransferase involved in cell wall biosynthesis
VSKFRRRILKRQGSYAYFAPQALDANARNVNRFIAPHSDAVVFRSAARWCRCRPSVPYFIYLDAVTHTFFHNTFSEANFIQADLERIWSEESDFLENASGVYFESDWGRQKAIAAYGLKADHYFVAGRGGVIGPPPADSWDGEGRSLVTIAMDFRQKGGDVVADAYCRLKAEFASLSWTIIGGKPDLDLPFDGITYEGVLRPDVESDAQRLRSILADAFLLVHPSREDTSPLVITEAAYFGCPSVAVNAFAIPELVVDGRTGLLVDAPPQADRLAEAIRTLITNRQLYLDMRLEARRYSLANFQWNRVGSIICDGISQVIDR